MMPSAVLLFFDLVLFWYLELSYIDFGALVNGISLSGLGPIVIPPCLVLGGMLDICLSFLTTRTPLLMLSSNTESDLPA